MITTWARMNQRFEEMEQRMNRRLDEMDERINRHLNELELRLGRVQRLSSYVRAPNRVAPQSLADKSIIELQSAVRYYDSQCWT